MTDDLLERLDHVAGTHGPYEIITVYATIVIEAAARIRELEAKVDLWKEAYRSVANDLNLVVPELSSLREEVKQLKAKVRDLQIDLEDAMANPERFL